MPKGWFGGRPEEIRDTLPVSDTFQVIAESESAWCDVCRKSFDAKNNHKKCERAKQKMQKKILQQHVKTMQEDYRKQQRIYKQKQRIDIKKEQEEKYKEFIKKYIYRIDLTVDQLEAFDQKSLAMINNKVAFAVLRSLIYGTFSCWSLMGIFAYLANFISASVSVNSNKYLLVPVSVICSLLTFLLWLLSENSHLDTIDKIRFLYFYVRNFLSR